jgi:glycosyltransferase involved in cell wall biosynthesis
MKISVMITTRSRCVDLRRTLDRLGGMDPLPDEILICADGCQDETVSMLIQQYAHVRLFENHEPVGSVGSRNRLLREAEGDWVLSLDDDSYPLDNAFFARIRDVIASHPEAAVISFPECRDKGVFAGMDKTPSVPGHYVSSYANCGAIMDRAFYLRQPGFPPIFGHMYEEPDFSIQCYAAGSSVWFEPSLTIQHHQSPVQRNHVRRHHQNARNELWSVWMRCPRTWIPFVSAFRLVRQLQYACKEGFVWAVQEPLWWGEAFAGLGQVRKRRKKVRWEVYLAWMRLARNPIRTKEELREAFRRVDSI